VTVINDRISLTIDKQGTWVVQLHATDATYERIVK